MNPKSAIQFTMIFFLIVVLYLLGTRIHINVGKVREIQDISEPPATPPPTYIPSPAPALNLEKKEEEGILGPYGYLTNDMIREMDNYPHKNPMMYKKRERVLLNNLVE